MVPDEITRVKRHPERGGYDKELLLDILGNGFVCQVAFQINGQPFIIPMNYYNDSEFIYVHGSPISRIMNTLRSRIPVAVSVMELNGLVLAKGLTDSSMNYRSAIAFGIPTELIGEDEKLDFFKEWIDHLVPGRREYIELPNHDELKGVSIFKIKLDQFSVKERKGGPVEMRKNPEMWSGVIPLSMKFSNPVLTSSPHVPEHIEKFIRTRNGGEK